MMIRAPHSPGSQQRGVISIVVILFIITAVIFVLGATSLLSGKKALDSKEYLDSIAALYVAESGAELAFAKISKDSATCSTYQSGGSTAVGRGQFQFVTAATPSDPNNCAIRAQGTVELARRTIEIEINPGTKLGTAGFGGTGIDPYLPITMRLFNDSGVRGMAVFNLAWRRHGSTGHEKDTPGGQSDAASCAGCSQLWSLESSSGTPSVGSLGTALPIAANTTVNVSQSLSFARNYAEVGMVMPGMGGATQPNLIGSYATVKDTTNTASSNPTTGTVASGFGSSNKWCSNSDPSSGADTLVFAVSGRAADDFTAQITSITFNSGGIPAQPITLLPASNRVAHFPGVDGSDFPNAQGDIFSEIWYTYNPYYYTAGASSTGSTVTVSSTAGLKESTILKVYSGTGAFVGNTRVVKGSITPTTFQISSAPTVPLVNATICGGICALFDNPASSSATTIFSITRTVVTDSQWAGGFVCLSGVNPDLIKPVTATNARLVRWHEIISNE